MVPIIAPKPSDAAGWEQWRDWITLNLGRKVLTNEEQRHVEYLYMARWPSSPAEIAEAERYRRAHAQLVREKIQAAKAGR